MADENLCLDSYLISEDTYTFPLKRIRLSTANAINIESSLKETTAGEGQV